MKGDSEVKFGVRGKFLPYFYVLVAFSVVFITGKSSFLYAQGPGSAWLYDRPITLNPATPNTNFQVKVTLSAGQYTNVRSDGSDLRFYDDAGNNCEYWIETWNTSGSSVIWVKVPHSGSGVILMYYGNASAPAVSNGNNTFDFFDDFAGSDLGANWQQTTSSGTVVVSGGSATLVCNSTPSGAAYISSSFSPKSSSFLLETKHRETAYNRIRYYASTSLFGNSPLTYDYGYFYEGSGAQSNAKIFWNGFPTSNTLTNNTDYLTQWRITDGSTYSWYTSNYLTGTAVTNGSRTTTYSQNIRYITIGVNEVAGTSTIVDWVRVRQYAATEPAIVVGNQITNSAPVTPAVFNSSGIFVVPAGVTSLTVQAWGGGGAGGQASTSANGKGGGGGGAYASSTLAVVPGNIFTVTVGDGGIAGTSSPSTSGGQSAFGDQVVALGGSNANNTTTSGNGGNGGQASGSTGTTKFSRGNGGNGNTGSGGGGGGGGSSASATLNGATGGNASGSTGGTGGNGSDGDGGNGGNNNGSGQVGTAPGGGGGGRGDIGSVSGNGADGRVIISWCVPPAAPVVTSPVKYCLNETASPLTATGINLLWHTAPSGGTGSSTAPTPSTSSAGTISYYVSQTAGCESARAQIDVITQSLPATTIEKTDLSCFGAGNGQILITGADGSGTYTGYSINNGASYQSSGTFTSLSAGQYTIRVKDSNGCESISIP